MSADTAAAPDRYDELELLPLAGESRPGSSGETRADTDPWSGETLLEITLADENDLNRAYARLAGGAA